jgi:hypothetical protein
MRRLFSDLATDLLGEWSCSSRKANPSPKITLHSVFSTSYYTILLTSSPAPL